LPNEGNKPLFLKPKKAMMFLTIAKIFELCNFCGKKCSKVIMEKLIV
jgi:hypothetical protein